MISLYFARTDMTGDLTKWFTDRDQAVAWAEENYADEAYVCRLKVEAFTPANVVDLLNDTGPENSAGCVIWEKTITGAPV